MQYLLYIYESMRIMVIIVIDICLCCTKSCNIGKKNDLKLSWWFLL